MKPLAIVVLLTFAACGRAAETPTQATGTTEPPSTSRTETATAVAKRVLVVHLVREGKVAVVSRPVPDTKASARAALLELLAGPTDREIGAGLTTAVPGDTSILTVSIESGTALVELSGDLGGALGLAQVVYTVTQFPTVDKVRVNGGEPLDRSAFESETPAIFVESPAPFETVLSPLRATGSANTFEATFWLTLLDADRDVLAEQFFTATSGSGTRGYFDATLPFDVETPQEGTLIAYEKSAKDGSHINVVEIPLRLFP